MRAPLYVHWRILANKLHACMVCHVARTVTQTLRRSSLVTLTLWTTRDIPHISLSPTQHMHASLHEEGCTQCPMCAHGYHRTQRRGMIHLFGWFAGIHKYVCVCVCVAYTPVCIYRYTYKKTQSRHTVISDTAYACMRECVLYVCVHVCKLSHAFLNTSTHTDVRTYNSIHALPVLFLTSPMTRGYIHTCLHTHTHAYTHTH
jgi:hypothetical protein